MLLNKKIFLWLVVVTIGTLSLSNLLFAKERNLAYYKDFWNPKFDGELLNYCTHKTHDCGLTVANRYCQLMGYTNSQKFTIEHNVGLANYIDENSKCQKYCKGFDCDGFKLIRCTNKIDRSSYEIGYLAKRTFVLPRFNKYRIDWCYADKNGCGKKAAYSFCRRLGFMYAGNFSKDINIAATRAIGNAKLCFGANCEAFKTITCYR